MFGAVSHSPGVPAGAVGGDTWSNRLSFSSYMTNSTVFDHTSRFRVSSLITACTNHIPWSGEALACSSKLSGGMIHDTAGSVPALTSLLNSAGKVGLNAFLCNDVVLSS